MSRRGTTDVAACPSHCALPPVTGLRLCDSHQIANKPAELRQVAALDHRDDPPYVLRH
jgi:hypothetical protein